MDVTNKKGVEIKNENVSFPPHPPKSYAYCSDTEFYPKIVSQIKNSTVLYHESTFLEAHKHLCIKTKHSTARQAAQIASQAQVETLILGHFSTRYGDVKQFKEEAQEVFKNVLLAKEGKEFIF